MQEAEAVRQLARDSYSAERFQLPPDLLAAAPDATRDPRGAPRCPSCSRPVQSRFL